MNDVRKMHLANTNDTQTSAWSTCLINAPHVFGSKCVISVGEKQVQALVNQTLSDSGLIANLHILSKETFLH